MKQEKIKCWKDSASKSWGMNESCVKKNGVLYFYVTTEQKKYLENHIDEIDGWCEQTIGEIPITIRFQEDWDEYDGEFGYYCECYFEDEIVVQSDVDTTEGLMDVYYKKGSDVSVGVKKYLNGDYSNNGNEVEFYTIGSDWNPEFYIRISSKGGEEITDEVIKSHIKIFYSVI